MLMEFDGDVDRGVAIGIADMDISAMKDQPLHHLLVAIRRRTVQRRSAAVVEDVDVSSMLPQPMDRGQMALSCRHVKRRISKVVPDVDLDDILMEDPADSEEVSVVSGVVEGSEAVSVADVEIGAMVEEALDGRKMAEAGGPVERRVAVMVSGVDVGAVREEDVDGLVVALDGGEVEGDVAVFVGEVEEGAVVDEGVDDEGVAMAADGEEEGGGSFSVLLVDVDSMFDQGDDLILGQRELHQFRMKSRVSCPVDPVEVVAVPEGSVSHCDKVGEAPEGEEVGGRGAV